MENGTLSFRLYLDFPYCLLFDVFVRSADKVVVYMLLYIFLNMWVRKGAYGKNDPHIKELCSSYKNMLQIFLKYSNDQLEKNWCYVHYSMFSRDIKIVVPDLFLPYQCLVYLQQGMKNTFLNFWAYSCYSLFDWQSSCCCGLPAAYKGGQTSLNDISKLLHPQEQFS